MVLQLDLIKVLYIDIKRSDYSGHNITTLTPDTWHQILSYLPLETILEFATLSKSCHNVVHNDDHFWHQQSQAVKDQWYWAENIELEQIKPNNMTWFEFFKTRYHIVHLYKNIIVILIFRRV